MIFKHCDTHSKNIHDINKYIEQGKHVFLLIYREGCPPCIATRPEWAKIKNALESKYKNNNNIVVADVDSEIYTFLKYIGDIDGYPTMKYISNYGKTIETYEDSSITRKDRTLASFINWIESKIDTTHNNNKATSSPFTLAKQLETKYSVKTKKQRGGKWSLKYKRSINCKSPKGFSQKNYCNRQKRHGRYKIKTRRNTK